MGAEALPEKVDRRDCDVPCKAPEKHDPDLATYPVVLKVAGELAGKLSEHHCNNSMLPTNATDSTCEPGCYNTAPLLLRMAHGEVDKSFAME